MVKNKNELTTIDFAKFIFSILVVYLHVPAFLTFSEKVNYFVTLPCKIAVPFFFLCSSYFLFKKIEDCKSMAEEKLVIKSYMKRLGKIWIKWSILYLVYRLLIMGGHIGQDIIDIKILLYYIRVLVQDFIFRGISEHLWYLPATIVGTFIVYFIRKKKGWLFSWSITGALLLVGLIGNSYNFLLPDNIQGVYKFIMSIILTTRNGVFWAPIFILMGSFIADKGIDAFHIKKTSMVLVVSISGLILEGILIFTNAEQLTYLDMMFFLVPLTFALFIILTHVNLRISNRLARRMRDMSLSIYLIHPLVLYFAEGVANVAGWKDLYNASAWYFIIVLLLSLLYGYLKSIRKFKKVE